MADAKTLMDSARAKGLIHGPGQTGAKVPVKLAGASAASVAKVRVQFVNVTPDMARAWLAGNNSANRKLRDSVVTSYARDMRNNSWLLNHQGLAFDANDTLLDGQHRLAALVEAGVTLPFLISTGWPVTNEKTASVMDTVDVGLGRSISDLLGLQHGITEARFVVSACNIIAKLCQPNARKLSVDMVLKITGVFKTGVQFSVKNKITTAGLRSAAVLGAIAFAYELHPDRTAKFQESLKTGAGMNTGHPALALRNNLLELNTSSRTKIKSSQLRLARAVLTHLHAYITDQKLTSLTDRNEAVEWFIERQAAPVAKVRAWFGSQNCDYTNQKAAPVRITDK